MRNAHTLLLLVAFVAGTVSPQTKISAEDVSSQEQKAAVVHFDARCMAGQWHEQIDNPFRWIFDVRGDKLKIWRTDGFVSGHFGRKSGSWQGDLKWGNGEVWRNVSLTPSTDCDEIRTNQIWWFRRR